MDDVYVYFVPMPKGIHEFVTPCSDGFTIYLDSNQDKHHQQQSFLHAISHIANNDFEKEDVQRIEYLTHKLEETK